jgi:hypothetical protein
MYDILKVSGLILEMVNSLEMYIIYCMTPVVAVVYCLRMGVGRMSAFEPRIGLTSTETPACCAENSRVLALRFNLGLKLTDRFFGLQSRIQSFRSVSTLGVSGPFNVMQNILVTKPDEVSRANYTHPFIMHYFQRLCNNLHLHLTINRKCRNQIFAIRPTIESVGVAETSCCFYMLDHLCLFIILISYALWPKS